MAKKAAVATVGKSEACRLGWAALGADAPGTKVAEWVKEHHKLDVPSATVSNMKKKVFETESGKKRGRKPGSHAPNKAPVATGDNLAADLVRSLVAGGDFEKAGKIIDALK
ncbi:MAG: hypothetical protein HY253_12940 [Burkholderiales bacterium]|nr:hypothetical protein [Burkholderiales bacterium]